MRSSILEIAAVLSSLAYTFLITYGSIWCWLFAFLSGLFFLILCYQRRIYAEVALQGFYIAMAVFGYLNWGEGLSDEPLTMDLEYHAIAILGGAVVVGFSGFTLSKISNSALPYLDSFTTVFSLIATAMMVMLYADNWLYWIVIDAVSIVLYFRRGLQLSAILFIFYTLMAINGYLQWNQLL